MEKSQLSFKKIQPENLGGNISIIWSHYGQKHSTKNSVTTTSPIYTLTDAVFQYFTLVKM